MIDVLLVLLIIFMVITPLTPKGLDALVPQPPRTRINRLLATTALCSPVIKGPGDKPALKSTRTTSRGRTWRSSERIFKTRAEKVMFVKADTDLPFNDVAQVIDTAHAAVSIRSGSSPPRSRLAASHGESGHGARFVWYVVERNAGHSTGSTSSG